MRKKVLVSFLFMSAAIVIIFVRDRLNEERREVMHITLSRLTTLSNEWHRFAVEKGRKPSSVEELAAMGWRSRNCYFDLFAPTPNTYYRSITVGSNTYIYSVGPDGKDDQLKETFQHFDGRMQNGDLSLVEWSSRTGEWFPKPIR